MTKEFAITAGNQGAGIPQQGHDGMAGRGSLPFVAVDVTNSENDLRDVLLRSAIAGAVESLQHALRSRPLLKRQTRVRRNDAVVDGCKKAMNGFKPVKPFDIKRDNRRDRTRAGREHLNPLAIAKRNHGVGALFVVLLAPIRGKRRVVTGMDEDSRRGRQDDNAGVVLRHPENRRRRVIVKRVYWEIATSSAGGSFPSARLCPFPSRTMPRSLDCTPRCGEAIPMRDPTRSASRHDRSELRSATEMHLASFVILPNINQLREDQDSRIG